MDAEPGARVPFSVTPSEGVVMPGQSLDVAVSFAPTEVGTCEALLTCDIPQLAPGTKLPSVDLVGVAKRPVCHVDLPESTYLSGDRTAMTGPTGMLGEIDAGMLYLRCHCCLDIELSKIMSGAHFST